MAYFQIAINCFQLFLTLFIVSLAFKVYRQHKEYCGIIDTATYLLEEMQNHDRKINILMQNLENRNDKIIKEEKNEAEG